MKLRTVLATAIPVDVVCASCGMTMTVAVGQPVVWADLDGDAYRDYYCVVCADKLKEEIDE